MRPDLWVIWPCIVMAAVAISGSIGSYWFPSQARLDAEYDAGLKDGKRQAIEPTTPTGLPGVARSATPSGAGQGAALADLEAAPRPQLAAGGSLFGEVPKIWAVQWDDTAEHLAELGRAHYEPLARDAELAPRDTALSPRWPAPVPGPEFPTSPIYDALAAEMAAQQLAPRPVTPGHGATSDPGPHRVTGDSEPLTGPGSDPWDLLAEQLGDPDDPEILEWSIRADAARCSEIRNELAQLRVALEA